MPFSLSNFVPLSTVEDALVTKNMVLGESVYGEKRIATEDEAGKVTYLNRSVSLYMFCL